MTCSRRDLCLLLPTAAASLGLAAQKTTLPSKAARFEDLRVAKNGANEFRPVMEGETHSGCPLEVHETLLAPGGMPHPAHHHRHEEMFLVREGIIEATINGQATRLGPGSVVFVASNEEHGIRNAGSTPAQYFVIALGKDA